MSTQTHEKSMNKDDMEQIQAVERVDTSRLSHNHSKSKDRAAQMLEKVDRRIELTPENNARVLRKIDLVLLPIVLGVYFLQALDKATLAYASVFGLIKATDLHGLQYSWLGSVVYLAQLVMQPLVAFLLVKMPIGKFLALTVFFWGAVLSCMPAAHSFTGLLVSRMFLGAFEAGVAPTFIAVTQMWWRRREQPVRLGAWYAMNGVTNMVGSLLTYGLGHINSPHLESYQIIFLFFGLITVAFSFVVLAFMPDSPISAKFLKGDDKLIAIERLRMNQQGIESHVWKWEHVREAVLDIKTWFWFAMMFSISVPSGGISTFGPLIVKSFGFDSFKTILLNIPFGAVQLVATMGGAFLATYWKKKGPVLILLCIPPIIGATVLLCLEHTASNRGPLLVAYYLISVYPGITPLIYSWSAANTGGDTKRKVTTGILTVGQCAGNVVGPTLYTTDEAPRYARGLRSNLALFIVLMILFSLNMLYLVFLNKKHSVMRVALGKSATFVDISMHGVKANSDEAQLSDHPERVGEKAFEDETDWKNEDFVYVY